MLKKSGLTIAVYLPKMLESRLRAAVRDPNELICAGNWADLTAILRRTHVDVLIVHPGIEDPPATPLIIRLIEEFPSVTPIAYGPLLPVMISAVLDLSKRGLYRVILQDVDDQPERIRGLLEAIPPRQLLTLVFVEIQKQVSRIPESLSKRIEYIFESPSTIQTVDEFAQLAALSRTRLFEVFKESGLGSPKRLLTAARLLRAYVYLRDPGHTFSHVATKLGFVDERVLRTHLRSILGVPIKQFRRYSDHEDFVQRLMEWVRGVGHDLEEEEEVEFPLH